VFWATSLSRTATSCICASKTTASLGRTVSSASPCYSCVTWPSEAAAPAGVRWPSVYDSTRPAGPCWGSFHSGPATTSPRSSSNSSPSVDIRKTPSNSRNERIDSRRDDRPGNALSAFPLPSFHSRAISSHSFAFPLTILWPILVWFPWSYLHSLLFTFPVIRVQKNRFFLKKAQPSGFFGVLLGFLFFGVFLDKQEKIGKIIQKLSNLKP